MNKGYCIVALVCLTLLSSVSVVPARPVMITFDPLPVFNDADLHFVPGITVYEEAGYRLVDPSGILYVGTLHQGYANAGNSTAVFNNSGLSGFTLTRSDNEEFILYSVVLSKLNLLTGPATVDIIGHLGSGGTRTRTVIVPDVSGPMTVPFEPAWNMLVSVEFNVGGFGARFQLDNIMVDLNALPTEHSSWGKIKALYGD